MAVEASLLTKNDIIDLLRTKYGLEGNIVVKKLDRGSSNLYEIHIKDKRYVLKEFKEDDNMYCCLKDYYENFNNMDISIKYRERINKFSDVFGKIIQ